MAAAGKSRGAARHRGDRGTGGGGYDAEPSVGGVAITDKLAESITILRRTRIDFTDPKLRDAIADLFPVGERSVPSKPVVPAPLSESAVPPAEPPDPDSDDSEP